MARDVLGDGLDLVVLDVERVAQVLVVGRAQVEVVVHEADAAQGRGAREELLAVADLVLQLVPQDQNLRTASVSW